MADEEMTDVAPETTVPISEQPAQSIEIEADAKDESEIKEEDGEDEDGDAGEEDEAGDSHMPKKKGRRWPKKEGTLDNNVYKALKAVADILTDHKYTKRGIDYYPSNLFRRIPNKRLYPDYHELIEDPRAISSLKGKIQRKEYGDVKEYVKDFAMIVHNAQVYNRPNSGPVKDVKYLEKLFKDEMEKLVAEGIVKEEDTIFPDLGFIPDATPEPDVISEDEVEEEEEEGEDEEDDEGDDSDDDRTKRGRKSRKSGGRRKVGDEDEDGAKGEDQRKKRGRPPKVDTPMEARIKAVLKGIRKPKDDDGLKIRHFERMPDKSQNPHYYQEIKNPVALDLIKRKAKRKKYNSLEHFMEDIKLMFTNAMAYNEDASIIYQDAAELLEEAQKLADAEKAKPDEDFLDEDGRLPLPNGMLYKNEIYKIGDWVHIENVNDVTKPIIAQIYRTWQDTDGQKWINACWYYRPEQTVHQHEKHFYPNEVVKTGQYRDHRIDEVLSKCFVMFFTRYNRGRPAGLPPNMEIYVCEARYNEEKHRMNKIKTWASCLPDEVRDKDYEMDMFDAPRKVRKEPSPLLRLLKDDAKENQKPTDVVSQIQWGSVDAPPILGAIYKGERDENQSPPPEPTPPPPPTPPPVVRPAMLPRPPSVPIPQQHPTRASPSMNPQMTPSYPSVQSSAPAYQRQNSYQQPLANRPYSATPPTPLPQQPRPYAPQQQFHQSSMATAHPSYPNSAPGSVYPRQQIAAAQPAQHANYPSPSSQIQREQDVYVLPDYVNASIPQEYLDQFPQDDQGRMLFFDKPPVDTSSVVQGRAEGDQKKPLAHSAKFIARKAELVKRIEKAKVEEEMKMAKLKRIEKERTGEEMAGEPAPEGVAGNEQARVDALLPAEDAFSGFAKAVLGMADRMNEITKAEYQQIYGENWQEQYHVDQARLQERKKKWAKEAEKNAEIMKHFPPKETAMYSFNNPNARYEDDYDPRYGF